MKSVYLVAGLIAAFLPMPLSHSNALTALVSTTKMLSIIKLITIKEKINAMQMDPSKHLATKLNMIEIFAIRN